jgi:hypothetical protein
MDRGDGRVSRLPRDCQRFQDLVEQQRDDALGDADLAFLVAHRFSCEPCATFEVEAEDAWNVLSNSGLEPETESNFDRRLLRKLKAQTVKEGFNYWTPAFIGAALACLSLFAALSLLSRSNILPTITPAGQASRKFESPDIRTTFELDRPVHLDR